MWATDALTDAQPSTSVVVRNGAAYSSGMSVPFHASFNLCRQGGLSILSKPQVPRRSICCRSLSVVVWMQAHGQWRLLHGMAARAMTPDVASWSEGLTSGRQRLVRYPVHAEAGGQLTL